MNPSRSAQTMALTAALRLTASLLLATALPQAHAEEDLSAPATSSSQLTRAEVIADLRLWQRAGVDRHVEVQQYGLETSEYQKAFAEYQRLRNGPAFRQEVARVQAEEASRHATSGR